MCGITGLILNEPEPQGARWLTAMTQQLYHRGPDDGGVVVFGNGGTPLVPRRLGKPEDPVSWPHVPVRVGIGSRRLAIIDTSMAGHQPMSSPDERVWLAYNGEIYNHAELRSELRERGIPFNGNSDTEVFLASYRAWGCDCFARFEGMWAALIVDWGAGMMVWARDRLGIKPLHVCRFKHGIAMASEIKPLLALPGATTGVNEAMLRDFLSEGLVDHTDNTLFDGIWSIPAGCHVRFNLRLRGLGGTLNKRGIVRRDWQPDMTWDRPEEATRCVRQALTNAVRSHLRSDVAVGSCLSGGLDSSAVVSLVHTLTSGSPSSLQLLEHTEGVTPPPDSAAMGTHWSQHTFTACLPGSALDETRHAEAVVAACPGLLSHRVIPTAEHLLADMTRLVQAQEQPFGSPSIYMQWEVMRLAKETGVRVLLDGQGGDELFCGYEGFIPPFIAALLRRGRLLRAIAEFRGAVQEKRYARMALAKHVFAHLLPQDARERLRQTVHARQRNWLLPDLFASEEPLGMCEALAMTPPEPLAGTKSATPLALHLWNVLRRESLPSLLRFEDRNSMAFSIEARIPFLDRRLVELAMTLPPSEKMRAGRLKTILREAVRDVVPEQISARQDKIGFSAPTTAWMREGLRPWWQDLLHSQSFRDRGCFETEGVDELVKRFDAGDDNAAVHLWRLAIVEQWARQTLDNVTQT